jgi:hypothetical protein
VYPLSFAGASGFNTADIATSKLAIQASNRGIFVKIAFPKHNLCQTQINS